LEAQLAVETGIAREAICVDFSSGKTTKVEGRLRNPKVTGKIIVETGLFTAKSRGNGIIMDSIKIKEFNYSQVWSEMHQSWCKLKENANNANMENFQRSFYLNSMTDRSTEKLTEITTLMYDAVVRLNALN
jgi:hypothetical protein